MWKPTKELAVLPHVVPVVVGMERPEVVLVVEEILEAAVFRAVPPQAAVMTRSRAKQRPTTSRRTSTMFSRTRRKDRLHLPSPKEHLRRR